MKKITSKPHFLSLLFMVLILIGCDPEQEQDPINFQIISPEFENGLMIVQRAATGTTTFKIETNQPAEFSYPFANANISVEPTGEVNISTRLPAVIYYVEVALAKNGLEKKTLPILVTSRPNEYKKVIHSLVNFQKHNDELVLFLRHMEATEGADREDSGIEDWWKSCEPTEARQLSIFGRNQALMIGNTLKRLNIPVSSGISSEMCRAFQTLEYMENSVFIHKYGLINHASCNNLEDIFPPLLELIPEYISSEELLLVAGHSNLLEGNQFANQINLFSMGDGFLLKNNSQGEMEFIGEVPYLLWRGLLYSDFL